MPRSLYPITPELFTAPRPRGNPWLEDELLHWQRVGIRTIVCLLTPPELAELGLTDAPHLARHLRLEYISHPIPDRGLPPDARQIRALAAQLANQSGVVCHCRQGIGRASLMAACILLYQGYSAVEAWTLIEEARGRPVPDTPSQRQWIHDTEAWLRMMEHFG